MTELPQQYKCSKNMFYSIEDVQRHLLGAVTKASRDFHINIDHILQENFWSTHTMHNVMYRYNAYTTCMSMSKYVYYTTLSSLLKSIGLEMYSPWILEKIAE